MDEPENPAKDEELWRFSLAFYDRPGIAESLVALQDRDGCDVNVMLFALWLGPPHSEAKSSNPCAASAEGSGIIPIAMCRICARTLKRSNSRARS
jgi:uncharacterized protein (TIGR02444 family)